MRRFITIEILLGCTVLSALLIVTLFLISEGEIHRNNAFLRRYPHHPVNREQAFDLRYNSYYIAGITADSIYLGNYTAPLLLVAFDRGLKDSVHSKIDWGAIGQYNFRAVKITLFDSILYVFDGTVPVIFKGNLRERKAHLLMFKRAYFSLLMPMGKDLLAVRSLSATTHENELGILKMTDSIKVTLAPDLLKKQLDGFFDTDGFLLFNQELRRLIYVYRYRNEFLVTDPALDLIYSGRLIDTISKAQLDIKKIKSKDQRKLGPGSTTVTYQAATSGAYLFASSQRLGKYEPEAMLDRASIIDVYDLQDQVYGFSLYLYEYKENRMRGFMVRGDDLFALMGQYLVRHSLNPNYFKTRDF